MLLNELDTKYSEANRITAQALRDYAEDHNNAMLKVDPEGSMDYELFITVADAIEAGDVDTVAREIDDADTEPRDFMMDLLLDKHPEMAKAVSMKVSGTLQSIFGMTGRMPKQEAVQEAKGKYEFGPATGKESYPAGYENDARMILYIITDLIPRIKDDELVRDVMNAMDRIDNNRASKADIALVMDLYKDIVAQGLDKPYKDAIGKIDQTYDPNADDDLDEGRVKGWVMDMEEDAYDMTREEFIKKHGASHADIWDRVHSEEDEYEPEPDFESVEEGVAEADKAVKAWAEKYNKHMGGNGDQLAHGWLQTHLNTGIESDSYSDEEYYAYNKKYKHESDLDWDDNDQERFFKESPITSAMHDEIDAIMQKYSIDEEDVNRILNYFEESKQVKEGTEMGQIGDVHIKQFGMGKGQVGIQLTSDKGQGYVQLNKEDAAKLAARLARWAGSSELAQPGEYESVNEEVSDEVYVDKSFNASMNLINRMEGKFSPGKALGRKIDAIGGDSSTLKDIAEALGNVYEALEDGHYNAMGHIQGESKK